MEPGFVVDRAHHSSYRVQTWFEGQPEKSFWNGLKTKGRRHCEVRTFRCTRCGFLESYTA
jgi:hypothetical protein